MDAPDFDRLTRSVSTQLSRRSLASLLGLGTLGVSAVGLPDLAEAKKKKKVKRNDFDCVDVGKFCKNDSQCCSGICEGKKKSRKCTAHDESTCQSGQEACLGPLVPCTTTTGSEGNCATTTGKASYCGHGGTCFPCSKDTDCEPTFGAGAACAVCAPCVGETPQGTACIGLSKQL